MAQSQQDRSAHRSIRRSKNIVPRTVGKKPSLTPLSGVRGRPSLVHRGYVRARNPVTIILMHRELATVDDAFEPPRTSALYLLTALLLFLVARDLWPGLAGWLSTFGLDLPTGSREIFGFRYALIAAV